VKDKHLKAYMKTAHAFAECSTARRLQVGAIVVKDNRIISIGYNGMPSGWDNNCEIVEESMEDNPWHDYSHLTSSGWMFGMGGRYIKLKSKPEVLHAETNAIAKLARSPESGEGATMFITHSPCLDCAKLIYQAGIKEVYYEQEYRDTAGVDFLKSCELQIHHTQPKN
jgi:dCMP deaminase